jgi:peptide-methionine (R)-S-oxide reductase
MLNQKILSFLSFTMFFLLLISNCAKAIESEPTKKNKFEITKTEGEWKKILPAEAYTVLREKGTERPFLSDMHSNKGKGHYVCAACGNQLFTSEAKFDSGTGWPSFYEPIDKQKVGEETDRSWGMTRTEVFCNRCGSHLGHVFNDGPPPTGLRYCMNAVSLKFIRSDKK